MARGLLVIDIQRDYFPGGGMPLVEPEAAAEAARAVLDDFRATGDPVVHLRHVWDSPEATFMRPGTPGQEIHPTVAPRDGEPVLDKTEPNGFLGTDLAAVLDELDVDQLHVVGMMSSMCVDATVRAAVDLGGIGGGQAVGGGIGMHAASIPAGGGRPRRAQPFPRNSRHFSWPASRTPLVIPFAAPWVTPSVIDFGSSSRPFPPFA